MRPDNGFGCTKFSGNIRRDLLTAFGNTFDASQHTAFPTPLAPPQIETGTFFVAVGIA
jgi:hypothetical protein